jgi:hypothetical protein
LSFYEDLVVQIPTEIFVTVGEKIEYVLTVFAAHSVEVVGYDVTRQAERVEVGDELAFVLQRERTHSVAVDFELAPMRGRWVLYKNLSLSARHPHSGNACKKS